MLRARFKSKYKKEYSMYSEEPELRNLKLLFGLYAFLLFTDFLMPQYFGINIGFDFTCTRIADVLICLYMVLNPQVFRHFCYTTVRCRVLIPSLLYLMVCGYTMVLSADINAFFLPLMEFLTLYLLIYGIRFVLGYKRAVRWSILCAYILSVYGLIEYVCRQSLMLKFLRTVPTNVRNAYRSGQYRIMGPCQHPLGYGLLLILFVALAALDVEKDKVNLFKRPVLMLLLLVNVFLTGSRSTLGIVILEFILILCFSCKENVKKSLLIAAGFLVALSIFLLLFSGTNLAKTIMLSITSVIDQFFGTNLAANYGAETTRLDDSENYRKVLPKIFQLDWLNPIVGRGLKRAFGAEIDGVYIHSIDNYYVMQYIKYAYPGLVTYVMFIITTLVCFVKEIFQYRSGLSKLILIGSFCYFFNLWWVDALQTLKFEYVMIALFFALVFAKRDEKRKCGVEG